MTSALALRRGFTLVETLLVLAVMALVSALVLPGLAASLRAIDRQDVERVLWDAITQAREAALNANRTVPLRADPAGRRLVWTEGGTTRVAAWPPGARIQFLQERPGHTILIGGRLREAEEVSLVHFYPDGTCDRFRAQVEEPTHGPRTVLIDPWTCAPVIAAETSRR